MCLTPRTIRALALSLLIAPNAIAAAHAWRFTHFAPAGARTPNPEDMSALARAATLLTGVTHPRPTNRRTPADLGLPFTGTTTWTIPGDRGTVVLFHGYGGAKADLLDEAQDLHAAGWTTLLVDFPGSGDAPGTTTTLGWREAEIVAAHAGPVVLYGKSMGSAAILRAVGSLGAHADALVLENPYDRLVTTVGHRFEAMGLPAQPGAALLTFWGGLELGYNGFAMDPVDFAARVRVPTLLLHGELDPRVHLDEARAIDAALAGPHALVVFPGAGHVGLHAADPELWRRSVLPFVDRYR